MAKGYTTEAKVENYTLTDIDSSFSAQLAIYIAAAENIIDQITGRNFIADTETSARVYDGDGEKELLIDDCIEITKVEAGNDDYGSAFTEISSTGTDRYFTEPANATAKGVPFHKLLLRVRNWIKGTQNHRITAKWGYSKEVPEDIEFAATVLVAGIINAQRKDQKEIASESIGNYKVSYASEKEQSDFELAKQILAKYTKIFI